MLLIASYLNPDISNQINLNLYLIFISALLLFIIFLANEASAGSETKESQKQIQKITFPTNAIICDRKFNHPLTLKQNFLNFKLNVLKNSTSLVNLKTFLQLYDPSGRLLAKSNETDLELVTKQTFPIDKKIIVYLMCTESTDSSNVQIPIQETITINKDSVLVHVSAPTLLYVGIAVINDPNLVAESVVQGLDFPTNMAFLGRDDILVLEKDKGTVQRIVNGQILEKPVLNVNVSGYGEGGLLGISVANTSKKSDAKYVYLYFTESKNGDISSQSKPMGNRLYRYEFADNKLINPKRLLSLPANEYGRHNGGKLVVGPDNNVYVTVGNLQGDLQTTQFYQKKTGYGYNSKAQNILNGHLPDGRAGILRITQDGKPVGKGILGNTYPLNLYYAYGIRNSFGMDFDPVTGNLWDTENGPAYGEEINLVKPGFNSGWNKVQGFWKNDGMKKGEYELQPNNLVDFKGRGIYSAPEFVWTTTVGPVALKFFNSDKFGKEYENDMFVADVKNGNIYHFDLNKERTKLSLPGPLKDKVANTTQELEDAIFAKFAGITDLQVGPDGYLYIVSFNSIFRIRPMYG